MCVCNLASIDFSIIVSCNHNPTTPALYFYNDAQTFLGIFFHYTSNSYFFIASVVTILKILQSYNIFYYRSCLQHVIRPSSEIPVPVLK